MFEIPHISIELGEDWLDWRKDPEVWEVKSIQSSNWHL